MLPRRRLRSRLKSPNEVIRYTLDGRDPDFSSGVYLAPIELPQGGTVKAAVFDDNKRVGQVISRSISGSSGDVINSAELPVTQNRDWKSYDWVKRHQEILEIAKTNPNSAQVVLVGDSITHFWAGEPKSQRVAGPLTWEKYIAPHKPLNLGFGWDRTENVLWRLRHGEIKGLKPKAFVVLIGTNNFATNSVAETAEGVQAVCEEIRKQAPNAKILLLGILPRSERPDANRAKVIDSNAILSSRASKFSDRFLDLSDKLVNTDGRITKAMMSDFLHPTEKGYDIIGAAIDQVLRDWGI
jgi:lysophospholipase L1-like esterase